MPVSETLASFTHLPPDVQKHLEALETYISDTDGKDTVTWCSDPPNTCIDDGTIDASEAVTAFNGIVASLAAPSDQVVVPREPTKEMAVAGRKALAVVADRMEEAKLLATSSIDFWQRAGHEPANEIYKAMLAASATPPQPSQDNGPDTNGGDVTDSPDDIVVL